ncbi:hypothetical protein BJ322DRAFT_1105068 [Thelephora terrestris]|uniref:Uncharacterized protein n=1 Tax=Thelephora terrestris TaxID=56493 RepID=A0A9P6HKY4_9AGAM|nr:hypothetical protein BJ322DRAFT_1105068 [Thelephora terrestris]
MPMTRSQARGPPEDTPAQNSSTPTLKPPKWGPAKSPKDPEAVRSNGAELLQTLLEEQEKELDDAVGPKGRGGRQSRGRGRGRGHGRGRGGGRDSATTPKLEDVETSKADDLVTKYTNIIQETTPDDMQVDASDSKSNSRDIDVDEIDEASSNVYRTDIRVELGEKREGSDTEEYEAWEGFGSDNANDSKSTTRKLLTPKASTKPGARMANAGKTVGKRKATATTERPKKQVASGMKMRTNVPSDPSDTDEISSYLGGFAGDEDHLTIAADRKEIIDSTKSSRQQSAMSTVSIAHAAPKKKVVEARKIGNLPQPYKEKFDTDFVPLNHPDAGTPLQRIHNSVYKNVDAIVDRQHVLIEPVKSKVIAWRVAIKRKTQRVVDELLNEEDNIFPAPSIHNYVAWLKPEAEMHRSCFQTDLTIIRRRCNSYLRYPSMFWITNFWAQLEGKCLNHLILETFAVHFSSSGVNDDPLNYLSPPPIGAFALAIIAVERVIESWRNGRVSDIKEFSWGNWGPSTAEYVRGLKKITDVRWTKILNGMQEFTPYKLRELSASPNESENYCTMAPDSDFSSDAGLDPPQEHKHGPFPEDQNHCLPNQSII